MMLLYVGTANAAPSSGIVDVNDNADKQWKGPYRAKEVN